MTVRDRPDTTPPLQSDGQATLLDRDVARPNRARGELRARFAHHGDRTRAIQCYEAGGLRLRFPKVVAGLTPECEAVCINTGGGMVGGDSATLDFACEAESTVTFTTQSAEKIYRSDGVGSTVDVSLALAPGARAEWLPQETILFDRTHLTRRLTVDMAATSALLMVEILVFGRLAMGEAMGTGYVHDRWRIRRDGRLIFAEEMHLDGAIADLLDRPALGGGARAVATVLLVARGAETMLDPVRAVLTEPATEAGASAWNGMLSLRALSPSPASLRATIVAVLKVLRGQAAPRVWQ